MKKSQHLLVTTLIEHCLISCEIRDITEYECNSHRNYEMLQCAFWEDTMSHTGILCSLLHVKRNPFHKYQPSFRNEETVCVHVNIHCETVNQAVRYDNSVITCGQEHEPGYTGTGPAFHWSLAHLIHYFEMQQCKQIKRRLLWREHTFWKGITINFYNKTTAPQLYDPVSFTQPWKTSSINSYTAQLRLITQQSYITIVITCIYSLLKGL
jgi:hypothetical protein